MGGELTAALTMALNLAVSGLRLCFDSDSDSDSEPDPCPKPNPSTNVGTLVP